MSSLSRLDDQLGAWLEAEAADPAPLGLAADVLARTSRHRPRARWLAVLHELPVAIGRGQTPVATTRLAWVAVGLLAMLLVVVGAVAGSRLLEERHVITTIAPDPLLVRDSHQAFRLAEGRVLIVGGYDGSGIAADAALVDPWTGGITAVPLVEGRGGGMAAASLEDGRVLVAGGFVATDGSGGVERTASAEIFDPASATFVPVGDMGYARGPALVLKAFVPIAVPLADGRVFVVGGTTEQEMGRGYPRLGDIFDAATATFRRATNMPCVPRLQPGEADTNGSTDRGYSGQEVRTADLMPDGRVLISCERWWDPRQGRSRDPVTPEQRFYAIDVETSRTDELAIDPKLVARTTALQDGSILLWTTAGDISLSNGERRDRYALARFDPLDRSRSDLGLETTWGTAASVLGAGRVALAGGYEPDTGAPSDRFQLLDPCSGAVDTVTTLATTRVGGTLTELDERHLLLVGGQLGHDPDMNQPAPPEVVTLEAVPAPACTG